MPSLLSPTGGGPGGRSYTPLADEVNPPYGNHAPTMTRNGTVVYGKRGSPVSDTAADSPIDNGRHDNHGSDPRNGNGNGVVPTYRSGSNETLSTISTVTTASLKGKERAVVQIPAHGDEGEEGDIGELRRGGTLRANAYGYPDRKGKGKERAWDEEMGMGVGVGRGQVEEIVQESYPPGNEALDDERRIQDTLAKFAAKDMARRRAARLSKITPASPTQASPASPTSSSSTTSFMRRPFSMIGPIGGGGAGGGGDPKRNSVMGIVGAFIGGGGGSAQKRDELPLASPTRPHMAVNPYDPPPRGLSLTPRMVSPASPTYPSPFADPISASGSPRQNQHDLRRDSLASASTEPPLQSPTDGEGFTYGYAGAQWRGGAGAGAGGAQAGAGRDGAVAVIPPKPPRGERWWHALCSWGDDLDGGHDDQNEGRNQAGRTNPFE